MNIKQEQIVNTGDILLFRGAGWLSWAIEWFGYSRYSHVGIVLKNPKFLNTELEDGLYLLESNLGELSDAENHIKKFGVQIVPLEERLKECPKGTVYIRKVDVKRDDEFYETFRKIHESIHNKPYDLVLLDWIHAEWNIQHPDSHLDPSDTNVSRFWCSALAAYVFFGLGLISYTPPTDVASWSTVPWSIIAPREFCSSEGKCLQWSCPITDDELYY